MAGHLRRQGPWNGHSRGELDGALRPIASYLTAFALPLAAGIVRLDGQYGAAAVIAPLLATGVHVLVRGRGYALLADPQGQAVLARPPVATRTTLESGVPLQVFDLPGVPLHCAAPPCRLSIARHAYSGQPITVGKRVGEGVYELVLTPLAPQGVLPSDGLAGPVSWAGGL